MSRDPSGLIGEQDELSSTAAAEMREFTDRKHDAAIKGHFGDNLRKFAARLRVPNLPDSFFKSLYANPPETGSDQPRALLAYYYAFGHTIEKYSSAIIAPFVVDSPVQQDQDSENATRIIEFALNHTPPGSQIILGSVRLHSVAFSGNKIELTDKYRLLNSSYYEEVRDDMEPLLNKLLA